MYSEKVIDHFQNPRNVGKIKNPDGVGKVGNIVCGDIMWLYIKVGKNETIKDIKFETYGCLAAIASSSAITELVKGQTIKQALELNKQEIIDSLDGLPPIKTHCSILAVDALMEAIYDYLQKNNKPIPKNLEEKHKKLEKEKQEIEETHKDWLNIEEKLHEENE